MYWTVIALAGFGAETAVAGLKSTIAEVNVIMGILFPRTLDEVDRHALLWSCEQQLSMSNEALGASDSINKSLHTTGLETGWTQWPGIIAGNGN